MTNKPKSKSKDSAKARKPKSPKKGKVARPAKAKTESKAKAPVNETQRRSVNPASRANSRPKRTAKSEPVPSSEAEQSVGLGVQAVEVSSTPRPVQPVVVSKPIQTDTGHQEAARKNLAHAAELHRQGNLDLAIQYYNRVLAMFPNSPNLLNDLGVALRASKRLPAAIACYQRAISLGRDGGGIWSNLGNAYRDLRQYEDAVRCHEKAVEIDGESPSNIYNLGLALRDVGQLQRSHEFFDRAIEIDPENPEYQWDRAITYLQQGDYRQGLERYDWRLKLSRAIAREFDRPRWTGDDLNGRTLFLYAEQGFGDMLQFARAIPIVAAQDCQLIVECHPSLLRLFATIDGDFRLISSGSPIPEHDLVAPLLSVPGILGWELDGLPAETPYFRPPEIHNLRVAQAGDARFKIGIVWAGKLTPRDRSCSLSDFVELASMPEIALYSLQLGERAADLGKQGAAGLIFDLSPNLNDFADTAAAMTQLDLIITIDSAPAHLAGGLGVPVWTLLNYVADWRWLMDRQDCPWYPTMRLFRQPTSEDWDSVFVDIKQALSDLLKNRPRAATK